MSRSFSKPTLFARLRQSWSAPRTSAAAARRPATSPVERLEGRRLLSVTPQGAGVTVGFGTDPFQPTGQQALIVNGTEGADHVDFDRTPDGRGLIVRINFAEAGRFNNTSFNRIYVFANGGDDYVTVTSHTRKTAVVFGGAGEDQVKGGSGADILVGGADNDFMTGRRGRDILIGGDGGDSMSGDEDDDLLVAGFTIYDGDGGGSTPAGNGSAGPAGLLGIQREWTSSRSYSSRLTNIRNGTGSTGGARLQSGVGATIFDDGQVDLLIGGGGRDVFFSQEDDAETTPGTERDEIGDEARDETSYDIDPDPGTGTPV